MFKRALTAYFVSQRYSTGSASTLEITRASPAVLGFAGISWERSIEGSVVCVGISSSYRNEVFSYCLKRAYKGILTQ